MCRVATQKPRAKTQHAKPQIGKVPNKGERGPADGELNEGSFPRLWRPEERARAVRARVLLETSVNHEQNLKSVNGAAAAGQQYDVATVERRLDDSVQEVFAAREAPKGQGLSFVLNVAPDESEEGEGAGGDPEAVVCGADDEGGGDGGCPHVCEGSGDVFSALYKYCCRELRSSQSEGGVSRAPGMAKVELSFVAQKAIVL